MDNTKPLPEREAGPPRIRKQAAELTEL
jgi:hypothetical protein